VEGCNYNLFQALSQYLYGGCEKKHKITDFLAKNPNWEFRIRGVIKISYLTRNVGFAFKS
jgi:hypothetical protein